MRLPNGRRVTIRARHASADNIYVRGLKLNGQASQRLWLTVAELQRGASLDYDMGATPDQERAGRDVSGLPSFEPETTTLP